MQLTLEEREREAYRDNNIDLANAIGKVIDLENYIAELHALIEEKIDQIDDVEWSERARSTIEAPC
jgi:NifB/MoaA-like Fe-S oxidoreductase